MLESDGKGVGQGVNERKQHMEKSVGFTCERCNLPHDLLRFCLRFRHVLLLYLYYLI